MIMIAYMLSLVNSELSQVFAIGKTYCLVIIAGILPHYKNWVELRRTQLGDPAVCNRNGTAHSEDKSMSLIDVVKFPAREKSQKQSPSKHEHANGRRVRDALHGAQSNDVFLNQLRDMLNGPYQRISEARFEEMLDILMEQDDFARSKFSAIEAGLEDVVVETTFLREKYDVLQERINIVVERSEAERSATRAAFEDALAKLREEFEAKSAILSETLKKSMKETEAETRRALAGLSSSVEDNKAESARLYEQAQTSTSHSLEARIAQWRAEIEDERKEDMSEVAAAMMEIGKRILSQRKAPI